MEEVLRVLWAEAAEERFRAQEEQRWVWWVELHYLERLRHAPSPPAQGLEEVDQDAG